ncbi:hypothetical protein EDC01DRAFT_500785 [Geopyxis carbonaria]|nr:hypothetical protein EDC01DRAFT_500785 [Geopyxis carbonaria]
MALCFLLDDSTPQTMLHLLNNGATVMLKNMLHQSKDILAIAKEKGLNMSKAAQGQLRDLRLIIEKSPAFVAQSLISISPQLLSLKVLEQIVTKYRHQGNFDAFLPQGVVYKIIEIVKPFLSLEKCPSQKVIHSHTLEICLSILESYAIGGSILMGDEISKENLSTVAGVFPTVQNWAQEKDLGPILLLSLRLNINITNNHADICDNLLHPRLLSALILVIESKFRQLSDNLEESSRLLSMDLLVLSLGLLLNLAELSPCAREMVQSSLKVSESSETGLDRLLNTFLERLERSKDADSLEKTEANVALGYLSLVLGELCIDNHIRYRVRSKLPNASFVSLLDVLEEFMGHYRRLELVTNRLRTYM